MCKIVSEDVLNFKGTLRLSDANPDGYCQVFSCGARCDHQLSTVLFLIAAGVSAGFAFLALMVGTRDQ
jgi:hypothetical protein